MKIKVGEIENSVLLVEQREKELTIRIPSDADMTAIKAAVEGAEEIDYTDDKGGLVYKIIGKYRLDFVGGEGESYSMRFKRTDTLEERIAVLEAENASLKEELLNTQEALAEIVEGGIVNG